jgi:hypothetical protein
MNVLLSIVTVHPGRVGLNIVLWYYPLEKLFKLKSDPSSCSLIWLLHQTGFTSQPPMLSSNIYIIYSCSSLLWRRLWSSGQSSWLQIQRSGFDPLRYQIFWEVRHWVHSFSWVQLRNCRGSGVISQGYDRGDALHWPLDSLYPEKLVLTSPTSGGRSVGIVHSQTKAMECSFFFTGVSSRRRSRPPARPFLWRFPNSTFFPRGEFRGLHLAPTFWTACNDWHCQLRVPAAQVSGPSGGATPSLVGLEEGTVKVWGSTPRHTDWLTSIVTLLWLWLWLWELWKGWLGEFKYFVTALMLTAISLSGDSSIGSLRHVDVGSVANVSEVHASSMAVEPKGRIWYIGRFATLFKCPLCTNGRINDRWIQSLNLGVCILCVLDQVQGFPSNATLFQ